MQTFGGWSGGGRGALGVDLEVLGVDLGPPEVNLGAPTPVSREPVPTPVREPVPNIGPGTGPGTVSRHRSGNRFPTPVPDTGSGHWLKALCENKAGGL